MLIRETVDTTVKGNGAKLIMRQLKVVDQNFDGAFKKFVVGPYVPITS